MTRIVQQLGKLVRPLASASLMVCAFIALPSTSQAWSIVTTPVEHDIYKHHAAFLKENMNGFISVKYRPTSIDIEYDQDQYGKSGYTQVVAPYVENTGAHYKQWNFVYDKTAQQIADAAGLIWTVVDLEEYKKNGQTKYAALLEKFTPQKNYFIYAQTSTAGLDAALDDDLAGGKILDMDVEDQGANSLHGSMVWNVAQTEIGWDTTMTWGEVEAKVWNNSGRRLLDLQRYENGTYMALWCKQNNGEWGKWSYFGDASWGFLQGLIDDGWRIHTTNSRRVNGDRLYSGVLVWNN